MIHSVSYYEELTGYCMRKWEMFICGICLRSALHSQFLSTTFSGMFMAILYVL